MALPKTTTDRIENEAEAYANKYLNGKVNTHEFCLLEEAYIAGATAEAERAQEELKNAQDAAAMFCNKYNVIATKLAETVDEAQNLVEALESIIEMNRREAFDQYGNANIAESWACVDVAINALQQWNAGKEVSSE